MPGRRLHTAHPRQHTGRRANEAPALIVAGRQDSIVGYRDGWSILEHLPRATFAVLDRAGHALEREQSALFKALAGEWLDRVEEYIEGQTGAVR
ncbi:MAG: hypothetical protein ABIR11_07385 [Candidatus Limnocylindrales bacterium]